MLTPLHNGHKAPLLPFGKPLHYSTAKAMARSALHFKEEANTSRIATPAMREGTLGHRIVLGGTIAPVYQGKRQGKAWTDFEAEHVAKGVKASEILTTAEFERAQEVANTVKDHPLVREYLEGAWTERPLTWRANGIACETLGVDILSPRRHGDLKFVPSVEPRKLQRHCEDMLYHAQIGWYDIGLDAIKYDPRPERPFLLCCEKSPPYDVVVLHLTPATLERGRQMCHSWLEQIKVCMESNSWPGHSQAPIDWELWKPDSFEFEGDDDEATEEVA